MNAVSSVWRDVEHYLEAYESAQAREGHADFTRFLPAAADRLYPRVLRELACLELEYSWKRGRPLRMQDFAAYPSLFNDPESLQALAFEEYRLRLQGGEQPTRAEYEERYGVQTASWPVADSGAAACPPPDKQQPRPTSPSAAGPTGEVEQAARAFQNFLQRNRGKDTDVVSWRESFRGSRASAELFCQLHETDPKAAARLAQAVTNMPEVGEEICGFRLVGELGQGAFAKVFLARQVELGNRLVVLKVSGEGGGESQLLAQLQHTNIVPIHSQHRVGIFHVACMPFFGATTLADVLRTFQHQPSLPASGAGLVGTLNELISTRVSQRQESEAGSQNLELRSQETGIKDEIRTRESPISALPPGPAAVDALRELPLSGPQSNIIRDHLKKLSYVDAVLWMVSRLAYGLAHAHEHGILHRDLKPANILLTDEGQPMLLDFNLAEDTKLRNNASAALLGGTLPYMSPEQLEAFQGAKNVLDGRSDIYALGVILFELLCGRLPFETPRGPMIDVLDKMIEARHAPLPRVPASHNGVTPAVDSIVRHCLEADPAKRYQTARQLQEDLQRQLANLPLKYAPEPSRRERFRKWSRRHPRLSSLATLGTVALVMLLALSFSFWLRFRHLERLEAHQSLAQSETDQREADLLLNDRQADFKQISKGAAHCLAVVERYGVREDNAWRTGPLLAHLAENEQDRAVDQIGHSLVLLSSANQKLAAWDKRAAERTEHLRAALRWNELAGRCWRGGEPRALLEQRAELCRLLGRSDEASAWEKKAAPMLVRDPRDHYLLGRKLVHEGNFLRSLDYLAKATLGRPSDFSAWMVRGNAYLGTGQNVEAIGCFNACIALQPQVHFAWFNRGLALLRRGKAGDAYADFDRAIALQPDYAPAYVSRAQAALDLKKPDQALADVSKAIELGRDVNFVYFFRAKARRALGDETGALRDDELGMAKEPLDAPSFVERGLRRRGEDDEGAKADFEQALRLEPRSLLALQCKAAHLSNYVKRDDEAEKVYDEALLWYPNAAILRVDRGVLRARRGAREDALRDGLEALRLDDGSMIHYQLACIYALISRGDADHTSKALHHLAAALRRDFARFKLIDGDRDLDPIRQDARFIQIVESAGALIRAERPKSAPAIQTPQ